MSGERMYSNNLRAGGDAAQAQLWLYDEKNVYFPQQRYAQRQRQHHVYGSDSSCDLDEDASATEILVEKHNCFVSGCRCCRFCMFVRWLKIACGL